MLIDKNIIKISFIIIILELVCRGIFPQYKSLYHDKGITGGIPFTLNSVGLRDREIKDKTSKRILCLGDSVTFGTQTRLEDTYPKVLETYFGYEVINGGLPDANTKIEYEYLVDNGLKFHPDIVILMVTLNDIGGALKDRPNLQRRKKLDIGNIRWFLRSKSYLFCFVELGMLRFIYHSGIKKYPTIESEKRELLCFSDNKGWNVIFGYLIKIRDLLEQEKINFMVVVCPYEFQVKDNFFNINLKNFTVNPQKRLSNFCQKNKITFLDLLPILKESGESLYFPLDYCHLNSRGHRLVAIAIYRELNIDGSS